VLADGSIRPFDIYAPEVAWDGAWRPVLVSAVGDEALLGMRLLARHELRIAAVPGGAVELPGGPVSRLPPFLAPGAVGQIAPKWFNANNMKQ
jgi:hypothetical protein